MSALTKINEWDEPEYIEEVDHLEDLINIVDGLNDLSYRLRDFIKPLNEHVTWANKFLERNKEGYMVKKGAIYNIEGIKDYEVPAPFTPSEYYSWVWELDKVIRVWETVANGLSRIAGSSEYKDDRIHTVPFGIYEAVQSYLDQNKRDANGINKD